MTTYGLALFDDAEELDFVGPWEVFTVSGMLLGGATPARAGRPRHGPHDRGRGSTHPLAKGLRVLPDHTFSSHPTLDVVLVPGGSASDRAMTSARSRRRLGDRRHVAWRGRWQGPAGAVAVPPGERPSAELGTGRDATVARRRPLGRRRSGGNAGVRDGLVGNDRTAARGRVTGGARRMAEDAQRGPPRQATAAIRPSGDGRLAARATRWAPALRARRPGPSVRPRGRGRAARGHARLRDVGGLNDDRSNAVLVCHALTGDSHVQGPSGPGHPTGGWWEDLIGPGKALDTEPLLPRLLERARRLPGQHRSRVPAPRRRPPLRLPVPGRVDPGHGSGAALPGRRAGHRAVADGHRRLDGGHAGARVGRPVPRPGALAGADRLHAGGQRPADRLVGGGTHGDRQRPELAGRRLLRRPARGRPPRGPGPRPPDRPDPLPLRGGVRPTLRAASRSRPSTTSTLGPSSRSSPTSTTTATSWSVASTPTPTWCSTGPWTSTTWPGAGAAWQAALARIDVPVCTMSISYRHAVPALPAAGAARPAGGAGHAGHPPRHRQPPRPRRLPAGVRPGRRGRREVPRLPLSRRGRRGGGAGADRDRAVPAAGRALRRPAHRRRVRPRRLVPQGRPRPPAQLEAALVGGEVAAVRRIGKLLLVDLAGIGPRSGCASA